MNTVLALVVGLATAFFLIKSRLQYLWLPKLPVQSGSGRPNVTVIIPARNEEKNIGAAVGCFPGVRVIVVNDDSSDRTADLAAAAGAEVISAPPLRKGNAGKPNACLAGARAATTDWLLFVDADTRYQPEFLSSMLAYARKKEVPILSAFLAQKCVSLSEKIILPYAFGLYFTGVSAKRINSIRYKDALANGQCLLIRRDAYNFFGGHATVLDSVVEDVQLASNAKRHRVDVRVVRAEHLGEVRMYESYSQIQHGFRKNSFRFLLLNPRTGIQVILASILLTSYAPVIALLISGDNWIAAAAYAAVPILCLIPWYAGPMVLLAPLAIYVFQFIALSAMFFSLHGRKAIWKGRPV